MDLDFRQQIGQLLKVVSFIVLVVLCSGCLSGNVPTSRNSTAKQTSTKQTSAHKQNAGKVPTSSKNRNSLENTVHFSSEWTKSELQVASTGENDNSLSKMEKDIITYLNLARINGPKFCTLYLDKYLSSPLSYGTSKTSPYVTSLRKDLANVKGLDPLVPDEGLRKAATYHANDMGRTGMVGHESSDGTSFANRIHKFSNLPYTGENCSYGGMNALGHVMMLLIDEGVTSLGHRENILNPEFNRIGVSVAPHKTYRDNCVMDFGRNALF